MTDNNENTLALERSQQLLKDRSDILSLPSEKRIDRILEYPQPAALVHSFSEEDFHFLIHDIGLQDSLPILSLASDKQKEFLLDMGVWAKDRIDTNALTKWLDLMLQADPNRLIKWLINEKQGFLELYFLKNITIQIREKNQDPSDFGEGYSTQDDTVYVKIIDIPFHDEAQEISEKERKEILTKLLNQMASFDYHTYRNLLIESTAIIASETEEESYRLRNVRLAEKGFLPFDEAIGIYQPLKTQDLKSKHPKTDWLSDQSSLLPVPLYHADMLEEDNLFARALLQVKDAAILQRLQVEFANLSNQIASADQKTIRSKKELQEIVKKACGYLSIGLEKLTIEENDSEPSLELVSAMFIQRFHLTNIFRVGFGLALELKWQADKWMRQSWFSKEGLTLSFWGEEWLGVLGGLFIKKPLYFDNYKTTDQLYREFFLIQDIHNTEVKLSEITEVDRLLSEMGIKIKTTFDGSLNFKSLMLTLWMRNCLGKTDELLPVNIADFANFFEYLFSEQPTDSQDTGRKIGKTVKESFLNWLSNKSNLSDHEISEKLGQTLENLFIEIESEYGSISAKDLDPKYMYHFL